MAKKLISDKKFHGISVVALSVLVILRIAIGWHFLYEGVAKLFTPGWSAAGYLSVSKWIFSGFFHWIASNSTALAIVNFLNIWGLVLIGIGLFFGCFTRAATISGIVLLLLYYVANPPFIGMDYGTITEGSYLFIDKNFVEMLALLVLTLFPTGAFVGLDRFIIAAKEKMAGTDSIFRKSVEQGEIKQPTPSGSLTRREVIRNLATLPIFGVFVGAVLKKRGWEVYEEKWLRKNVDTITSATVKTFNFASLSDLKMPIPHATIKDVELSRVILGGNLIGGWAHARDLLYASKLVKAYHTDEKVFETFALAERCGINAFLTNPAVLGVINKYWHRGIGEIKWISDCGGRNLIEGAKMSIDNGAVVCYTHGGQSDALVKQGKVDEIGKAVDFIRQNGLPAGIGGHSLEVPIACEKAGIKPDFYMKTFHPSDYWTFNPENKSLGYYLGSHDNAFCLHPNETIEFMREIEVPWIAFKTLAAGAVHPKEGFRFAFENGADFICVGMYDFQIVEDVNIACEVLTSELQRERPWRA